MREEDASVQVIAAILPKAQCVLYFLMGGNVMFILVVFAALKAKT